MKIFSYFFLTYIVIACSSNDNMSYEEYLESIDESESRVLNKKYKKKLLQDYNVISPSELSKLEKKHSKMLSYKKPKYKSKNKYVKKTYKKPEKSSYKTYTIKKGDTLWAISQRFGTSVDKLKKANNLKSNIINIGKTIKIP